MGRPRRSLDQPVRGEERCRRRYRKRCLGGENALGVSTRPTARVSCGPSSRLAQVADRRVRTGPARGSRNRSVAPADRRTLIRRATIDLWGIPPTAEEVDAFEADPTPDAFARLVDRLLASPRYGERWGRHWLDVARYADTKGYVFTQDRRYPYAYTYRDYVIAAFNADLRLRPVHRRSRSPPTSSHRMATTAGRWPPWAS